MIFNISSPISDFYSKSMLKAIALQISTFFSEFYTISKISIISIPHSALD